MPPMAYLRQKMVDPRVIKKTNQFNEGGHDLVHGSQTAGDHNILEPRGFGWEIRLSNGTMIDASNAGAYVNAQGQITLPAGVTGVAMANLEGSSVHSQNGLYTISFDHINKIQFTDGGLGGSNTSIGLANSTGSIANPTVNGAGATVIHSRDGDKTINAGSGHDTVIVGNGKEVINLGSGNDVVSFGTNVNTSLANTYTVHGGSGENWLDLSGFGQNVHIQLSNGLNTTVNAITYDNVYNLGHNVTGTITSGNTVIKIDHIDKIIV